jgi:hypothetical protein
VRLIHIEAAPHAPERDWTSAARPTAKSTAAASSSETADSVLLRAIAKFLDAVLQFTFVALTEILRASLHTADAHRFGRGIRSSTVEWEACEIARALAACGRSAIATY